MVGMVVLTRVLPVHPQPPTACLEATESHLCCISDFTCFSKPVSLLLWRSCKGTKPRTESSRVKSSTCTWWQWRVVVTSLRCKTFVLGQKLKSLLWEKHEHRCLPHLNLHYLFAIIIYIFCYNNFSKKKGIPYWLPPPTDPKMSLSLQKNHSTSA